ncbi:NUDIX hydrolase [Wenzhouxiangella sp. XN24]|uniref:NUDIX hydrolase n=1 Tax=Wenzhouxiangella sp. XN24 TaxID=2713569 RepID=UPI0013EAC128|nr:NUDIX hydrolase [Wenzhouxiangella sp. XN24]NGX14831.1 NUDIX hydrolase [Wenzhouxiangella sp. XN24]
MNFCSACGHTVELRIPAGDSFTRYVCPSCGKVHYQNPLLVVGCVPEWNDQVLLCRRAIEPRRGYWTIPAGFMENDETLAEGAARETMEEAMARVEIQDMFAVVDVVHARQVHVMFRARLLDGRFGAGAESLEVALFDPGDIPWDEIAFLSVRFALEKFLEDRAAGVVRLHTTALERRGGG